MITFEYIGRSRMDDIRRVRSTSHYALARDLVRRRLVIICGVNSSLFNYNRGPLRGELISDEDIGRATLKALQKGRPYPNSTDMTRSDLFVVQLVNQENEPMYNQREYYDVYVIK